MANTIGNLAIKLTANTSQFARKMQRAKGPLKRFAGGVLSAATKVAKFGGALAALAGAGAFVMLTKNAMKSIDVLTKTADKLGTTTEALSQMHFASEAAGVNIKTFDMALQRMTRRVAEAARGTGEAKDAITELGLDAEKLKLMGPTEALKVIADSFKGVGSQADRVRIAMKLFDSEGVSLVNVLSMGSEGLEEMAEEADRLGLSFSRVDAAKVEQANLAIMEMKSVFKGMFQQIAIQLSPVIEALADKFTEAATSGTSMSTKVINGMEKLAKTAVFVGRIVDALNLMIQAVSFAGSKLTATFLDDLKGILEFFDVEVPESIDRMADGARESLEKAANNIDDILSKNLGTSEVEKFFDDVQRKSQETAEAIAANVEDMRLAPALNEDLLAQAKAMEAHRKKMESAAKSVFESTRTPIENAQKEMEQLKELLKLGLIDEDVFERKVEQNRQAAVDRMKDKKEQNVGMFGTGRIETMALTGAAQQNAQKTKKTEIESKQIEETNDLLRGLAAIWTTKSMTVG